MEKKNGKGKEYIYGDIIRFDGEYLNDKKWNGKGYDEHGNIIYELKNGKGVVKDFCLENSQYEYLYAKKNGKGKIYYYDGTWNSRT